MTEHYYTQSPQVEHNVRQIDVAVRDVHLSLRTDNGVFSKRALDEATRRLLEQVQLAEQAEVVDLGTGYGVVAAVLGTVYPASKWLLLDINERALELAKQNTMFMAERRSLQQSDGIPAALSDRFSDVILNPPIRAGKAVVYRLFADAHRALQKGGRLWLVIQKKHGAASAKVELARLFGEIDTLSKKAGYFIFCCKKS